jgi:hypothetical protein
MNATSPGIIAAVVIAAAWLLVAVLGAIAAHRRGYGWRRDRW